MTPTRSRMMAAVVPLCLLVGLSAVACSKTSSDPAGSSTSLSGECGQVPSGKLDDKSGIIAGLGQTYENAYAGYASTIEASAWAHFKPKGDGPYTVGVAFVSPYNAGQVNLTQAVVDGLKALPNVKKVVLLESNPAQPTQQGQQANQLIQQGIDILITEPPIPTAFVTIAKKAADAGIPMLSVLNDTPSKDAINLTSNSFRDGAVAAAAMARTIKGTGTVLGVHGLAGVALDAEVFAGAKAAFGKCPGITFDDSLTGDFDPATAKLQVSNYLGSHPGKIAGVVQPGSMVSGILGAFQQAGRPVPPMTFFTETEGANAYWADHVHSYTATGVGIDSKAVGEATVRVVKLLLAGHGPKVNELVTPQDVLTNNNIRDWVSPDASESDTASATGPPNNFLPGWYLDKLFN
jgi:ABC-type sugar transport system substrate-binding protein